MERILTQLLECSIWYPGLAIIRRRDYCIDWETQRNPAWSATSRCSTQGGKPLGGSPTISEEQFEAFGLGFPSKSGVR